MSSYGICIECGNMKDHPNLSICLNCHEKEVHELSKIKEYLAGHPLANALTISMETDIPSNRITRLLRQGSLMQWT